MSRLEQLIERAKAEKFTEAEAVECTRASYNEGINTVIAIACEVLGAKPTATEIRRAAMAMADTPHVPKAEPFSWQQAADKAKAALMTVYGGKDAA